MKSFYCTPCDKHPVTIYEIKGHTLMRYDDTEQDYKRTYENAPVFFCYTCGSVLKYKPDVGVSEIFQKKMKSFNEYMDYREWKAKQAELVKKGKANTKHAMKGAKNVRIKPKSKHKPSKRLSLFEEE